MNRRHARRQQLVDTATVHVEDFEAPAPDIDGVAFLGQPPHRREDHAGSGVGAVAAALVLMGGWPQTERVSLLLAPDGQRSSHPSADLESEQRPLADLGTDLIVQPGAFLIWR